MKKKWLSAMLVSAMLLGVFSSCGSFTSSTEQSDGSQAESTESTESNELPKVVWGFTVNGSDYDPDKWPTDVFKDFQEEVRNYAGAEIEFMGWQDNQSFELALAGGDLPDIIMVQKDYCQTLLKSGAVMALDDYLDLAPNLVSASPVRIEALRKYFSKDGDGKLYFITPYSGIESVGSDWWNGLTIRWDYYKELGYPEVKNEDDFLKVVQQAVENHPTTEDGKKVYGVGTFSDGTLWGWWIRGCMYGYHNITDVYSMDYRDADNTKIVHNFMDLESPVWRDIRYYYKANQMGIFDPDSFTMKGEDLNAKATNGQLVAAICSWYGGDLLGQEREKDPETMAQYMVLPVEGQYNWGNQKTELGWPFYHGVNAKTENIEEIMKIFDYLNTTEAARLCSMGKEGGIWETVDGKPTVKQEYIDLRMNGTPEEIRQKTNGLWGICGLAASVECADGAKADLWSDPDIWKLSLSSAQKDYSNHYGVDVPSQAAEKLIAEGKAFDKSQNGIAFDAITLLSPPTQDISRIDTRCLDIMIKAIPQLVLAKDQTEFDSIQAQTLAELEAADVQTSLDWWNTNFNDVITFLKSVQ